MYRKFVPALLVALFASAFVVPMKTEAAVTPVVAQNCADGTLVANVEVTILNDADSAVWGGYWAMDTTHTNIKAYSLGDGEYCVVRIDGGSFVTFGTASPNNTGVVAAGVTGKIGGGYTLLVHDAVFNPDQAYGDLGSFDLGCDQLGNCGSFSTLGLLFDSYASYNYLQWGWTYTTCGNGTWVNADYANTGDITGDPVACPTYATPLTRMYVYYSATPFFGETNTLWIFSSVGIPSVEIVKAWAGDKFPDGFDIVKGGLVCQDYLYDDGTDKGYFSCDATMAWTGENRAYLRNDPEGPAFDLYPKIEKYNQMLAELGLTPSL